MFEVIFDEKAIDFLDNLPKEVKSRIFNKVISTKESPFYPNNQSHEKRIPNLGLFKLFHHRNL